MAKVILLCGKIDCGKTTYAYRLIKDSRAVLLSIDEIKLALYGQDAGEKHDEYTARVEQYLLDKSLQLVEADIDVVLDWGFWGKASRDAVKTFYEQHGIQVQLHYLAIDDETVKKRMEKRNRAVKAGKEQAYFVDEGLAKKCLSLFEEPVENEIDVLIKE